MKDLYPPKTPPRRSVRSSHLTPSSTPFVTPSKTPSRHHGLGSRTLSRKTPIPRRLCTPSRTSSTPYFTPCGDTPSKTDNDRFIPSRRHMSVELCRRALATGGEKRPLDEATADSSSSPTSPPKPSSETPLQKEFKRRMLSSLCNIPLDKLTEEGEPTGLMSFGGSSYDSARSVTQSHNSMQQNHNPFEHDTLRTMKLGPTDMDPTATNSVAKKVFRKVPSAPLRILDAPDIVDDYYLNLISWGKNNVLAVALAQSVYLWNATSGEIQHLFTTEGASDYVTSVAWCMVPGMTSHVAIGTNSQEIHVYDATGPAARHVRTMVGHRGRVTTLTWTQQCLTSGSRDSDIFNHDIRARGGQDIVSKYKHHQQEVCGLKWNEEGSTLASGSNDNTVCLWDAAMTGQGSYHRPRNQNEHAPRLVLDQHKAAVKALDWCPFHRGLLASGGGTADRSIKFWNTTSGAMLNSIDTGSQVCSIVWSKHQRELCSSHGYADNQLILWKYPTMTKIKELTGHTARVLNMELSPDGSSVVSAAADETLRFWDIFGTPSSIHRTATGTGLTRPELSFGGPSIR